MGLPVRTAVLIAVVPLLSGCLARTVVAVATAPVKVAGKAADIATTSQAEADQARGRELRRREARLGELERRYRREAERCEQGDTAACQRRDALGAEIQKLLPGVPLESR